MRKPTHGLGGRNLVEEMGIRKAAKRLVELAADFSTEEEWLGDISACQRIAADPALDRLSDDVVTGFSFSFRYGGTYLSASRETAARYSLIYSQGGEALTHTLKLYRRLLGLKPELALNDCFSPLAGFKRDSASPIVAEASGVAVSALRAERGGQIDWLLAQMSEALLDSEFYDAIVDQHNFELTEPIASDHLRFYGVEEVTEYDDAGGSRRAFHFPEYRPV